jgi:glycosyltransferase involved in cell wall biosynthesis
MRVPILLVLNTFDPGGTEHQMTELICRLDRRRFDVSVACFRNRGILRERLAAAQVPVTEFPIRGLASANAASHMLSFARLCRAGGIRLVHACDFYANVFALPAATLAGVPVRIGSRRDVTLPERSPNQRRVQRWSYRLAHRVVANSAAAAEQLIREGVPPARVARIDNGLDLERFEPALPPHPPVVTTVAHLRPGKGHDVLLAAAARVVERRPDVRFRIVGDGVRREALEHIAHDLCLERHVHFVGHRDDIAALLRESTLFAFPSFMEASPNAVLEAMAAALPIVTTRVGGIPEVIQHEDNGLLVAASDEAALAAAILRLLEDTALAARLGASARKTVNARFTFERMAAEFESLYLAELEKRSQKTLFAARRLRNAAD